MAKFVVRGSIPKKLIIATLCALAYACVLTPQAFAQHGGHEGGGHVGGGGHFGGGARASVPHASAPRASHGTTVPPQVIIRQRPIFIHRRVFVHAPIFGFRGGFFNSWWVNCGPLWRWDYGYGCDNFLPYGAGFENYVTIPVYETAPYLYGGGERELVQLFLKQGTAWNVTDYWFVGDQVHFITLEEGGTKSVERTMALSELDLQKSIDANTRRGFRFVKRDAPVEQYLREHPEANPPLVEPQEKN
jgi:hypothetical protein